MNETKRGKKFADFAVVMIVVAMIVSAAYGALGFRQTGIGEYLVFVVPLLTLPPAIGVVWLMRFARNPRASRRELGYLAAYWGVVLGCFAALYRWWSSQ